MKEVEIMPYILTLRIDEQAQHFFNIKRNTYFPVERNLVPAHLLMFHQLPNEPGTLFYLENIAYHVFNVEVTRLIFLGNGVAYAVESIELNALHRIIKNHFKPVLIAQDLQGFRPHVTVQNKVNPQIAKDTMATLSADFRPFKIEIMGLELWHYLGGKWAWAAFYPFSLS